MPDDNWRNRHKRDLDAKFGSVFDYQPLHVRIYSASRFRACYLHRYVVLLLSTCIRLPKSKGITSVYFRFAYIAYIQTIQINFMIETCACSWWYAHFVHHIYVYSTYRYFPRGKIIDLNNRYENQYATESSRLPSIYVKCGTRDKKLCLVTGFWASPLLIHYYTKID